MKQFFITVLLMTPLTSVFSAPNSIQAIQTTPTIDGFITNLEWPEQHAIKLSRAFHDQRNIKLFYAHDAQNLYLAADIEDQALWADGAGNGSGNIWDSYTDDSIEWYFDLDQSKDTHLQGSDRFLALNIGNFSDPANGNNIVSRRSFNAGDGYGGAIGLLNPQTLEGINYKVQYRGTVNNDNDIDQGYSIEVAIPWALLPGALHSDGDSIGINTTIISDDSGGTRDFSDNRGIEPANLRFTLPIFIDEYVELKHSENHSSQSGLSGPAAYTTLKFHNNNDVTAPAKIANLITGNLRPYSIKLQWNNSGDNNNQGSASGYQIRYSTQPITNDNFSQARNWPFNKHLDLSGFSTTTIRVMGLKPNTTYYFAVRAFDEAHNYGPIASTPPIKTLSIEALNSAIPTDKYQGLISISPGGRYFIKENGQPIIPIGSHYLFQDDAIRYLYDDDIWTGSKCHNFTKNPEADEKISNYFAKLKASGTTVMRLILEDSSLNVPNDGAFNQQNCAYWLESPRGNFNPKMADFLTKILRLSAENGIYVLISPFETFFYDEYLPRMAWHTSQGGPLTNINDFFKSYDAFTMAKARWSWVINTINSSGYADAVFGYEIMNEWDSFEWTRPANDANTDAQIRKTFIEALAKHVRSLDNEHLLVSSTTSLDPRGALGNFIYDSNVFDAVLPHLYLPGNREPWNNPTPHLGTSVVKEQANILSWWTSNLANAKPVLNGEWGPSDGWLPNNIQPKYFSAFSQADDELITRKLWFSELASGAAGPGIRMQGGVRGGSKHGLHLSENMFATAKTLSTFLEPNGHDGKGLDFTNFTSENLQGSLSISNTVASLVATGTSDKRQGIIYIHQDKNKSFATVTNAHLNISSLSGGGAIQAEFWSTDNNQIEAKHIVSASSANIAAPNASQFIIPAFNDDWIIKFYEKYSTRLINWREHGQHVFALKHKDMVAAGAVDVYLVYRLNGELFSLIRTSHNQISTISGVVPMRTNVTLVDGVDELVKVPVSGNNKVDIYIATVRSGEPIENYNFKTLQFLQLVL